MRDGCVSYFWVVGFRRVFIILTLAALPASATEGGGSAATSATASSALMPGSLREMSAQLDDGQVLIENMPVYPSGQRWFLPLGELVRGIGLSIEVTPAAGTVEGYISDPEQPFLVHIKECKLTLEGVVSQFDCTEAFVHEDDVFVSSDLLEEILPIEADVNSFRSEVTIRVRQGAENLVIRPGLSRSRTSVYDPGFPKVQIPARRIDGFTIDQQIGYFNERTGTNKINEFRHDTLLTGELFGMEANAFVSGRSDNFDRQRYTLAKRDVEGGLPFGAREFQLLDVTFPSLPMVGAAGVFRGAMISSFPLASPSQFGTQDFIGDLTGGWEVELYQNDVLIDRRASASGRYEFRSVPLTYGTNRFRLAFYGPQGQRIERFETYSIDSSFLKPGEQSYRVAVANDIGARARWLLQYDRSLRKNFNLYSAATRFAPEGASELRTYGLLGVRAYVDKLLLATQAASSEQGGAAWSSSVQAPFQQASFGVSYTRLSNFLSEVFKLERGRTPRDVLKSNVSFDLFSALTVRFNFELGKTYYTDDVSNDTLTSRISTRTGPVALFNTLTYDQGANGGTGELATQTTYGASELRTKLNYNQRAINTGTIEVQRRLNDVTTAGVGWVETFRVDLRKHYANLTREFAWLSLTANASLESRGDFALGALLSYSFGREPREGKWWIDAKPQALKGSASIVAFMDTNQNGIRDIEEKPIEGAELIVNQQEVGAKTNESGVVFVRGLDAQAPADISLSSASLGAAQKRPSPRGARVYPRAGKTAQLEFPVIAMSEVAGFVYVRSRVGLVAKRGIRVILRDATTGRDIKTTLSDGDGFYIFDEIRAGSYRIDLDVPQIRGLKLWGERLSHTLDAGPEGLIDNTLDFVLDPDATPRSKSKTRAPLE